MSANNYILIRQTDNGQFHVSERDADTTRKILDIGTATDSIEALKVAEGYFNENEVEYGIRYSNYKLQGSGVGYREEG